MKRKKKWINKTHSQRYWWVKVLFDDSAGNHSNTLSNSCEEFDGVPL